MKQADSFVVKLPIEFPTLISYILINQKLDIVSSEDVVGVVGSHVPDILVSNINFDMTAEGELYQVPPLFSSSRSHVLLELMEVSKTLQEVITTSTFHKNKVDETIKIMVSKGVELPLPRLLKRIMVEMFEDNEDN